MARESLKRAKNTEKKNVVLDTERDFSRIKEGIKLNQGKIAEFLSQRVGPGDWELTETNVPLEEDGGVIDMVFSCSDGKKEKYILVDISVPHLGVGQKYLLPTQAKLFQKAREVAATRVKKAIILVRKGTETISLQALKVRCPIIEIQLENIVKQATKSAKRHEQVEEKEEIPTEKQEKQNRRKSSKSEKAEKIEKKDKNAKSSEDSYDEDYSEEAKPKKKGFSSLSEDLLYALKEAVVHEALSTSYKRNNKYIRRGLWHWIEREILDPNVHFFLIILSSIYQGKTGEILSKRFKTVEAYTENPENVISAIFCRDNGVADEIRRNSDRHKKALTKFLCCFCQMPPYEYLKSLFLKEYRSSSDGLKARMSVYTTLEQLLARCGFEGEKEIKYPLEILDELKIFQGIFCGNYETLRTDNASKKLKHLVPQIEWEADDIYALRDQLANVLGLPAAEFNLNAFLPQAFFQDARNMAENRKDALRQHGAQVKESRNGQQSDSDEAPVKMSRQERMALHKQAKLERQAAKRKYDDEYMPKKHSQHDEDIDMPMFSETGEQLSEEARAEQRSDRERLIHQEMGVDEVKRILDDPYAFTKPTSRNIPREDEENAENVEVQNEDPREESNEVEEEKLPVVERELPVVRKRSRYADVDESRHRHFENYGGIDEEDPDVIKLSLAMANHEDEDDNSEDSEKSPEFSGENEAGMEEDFDEIVPTKTMIMNGFRPNMNQGSRNGNRRQGFQKRHQNNNDSGNRGDGRGSHDGMRNNRSGNNRSNNRNDGNNGGYREHKRYNNNRNGGNGGFHRRSRRDSGRE